MQNKIGTIKNPLTVIAIFSGTAEISGTAVLPLLDSANQEMYIWFLMAFPFTLIALFFITLNWNHKVLYAPSDFKDENNFIDIVSKATLQDKFEKLSKNDEIEIKDESDTETESEVTTDDLINNFKEVFSSEITTKLDREKRKEFQKLIHSKTIEESLFAEKLVIEKLRNELNIDIDTESKIELNKQKFIFDGLIQNDNQLTVIEVKYFRELRTALSSRFNYTLASFEKLYINLNEEQKQNFSIILAIVTDTPDKKIIEKLKDRIKKHYNVNIILKVYEYDELAKEVLTQNS